MTAPAPRRGDVWFADVPGDKRRPVLVLETSLVQESVANFDRTFLLARTRLIRRLGRAPAPAMGAACRALAIAAGCRP